jgi:hypothetical protein
VFGSQDPRIRLALLCDYALTSEDGKVSAIGLFSTINFAQLPGNYPRFFVVIVAVLDTGSHEAQLSLLGPRGNEVIPNGPTMNLDVPTGSTESNLIIGFDNLGFEHAGIYQLQLSIDGTVAMRLPFSVLTSSDQPMTPMGNA